VTAKERPVRRIREIWRSSPVQKAAVAASGLVLFGWVFLHVAGNLTAFGGAAVIDAYSAALHARWPLLWAVRAAVLAALVVHAVNAAALARRSRRAAGSRAAAPPYREATLASRTMRVSGVLLLGFVVGHVLHMTFGVGVPGFAAGAVYRNLAVGLAHPAVAVAYIGAAALVGLHVHHALWAAPRSLGVVQEGARRRSPFATAAACAIALGFAALPVAVALGAVR
jgi:succinate dehydrogenase / fumarate reductase cytochrome b subunit